MNSEALEQWMAGQSFLVVEDISTSRMLVAGILRSLGASRVASAADGTEALEKMARHNPNIVFCDWMMPGMDGMDLLARIKADYPAAKVVMLTAKTEAEEIAEARARGADGFIGKPFSRNALMEALPPLMG